MSFLRWIVTNLLPSLVASLLSSLLGTTLFLWWQGLQSVPVWCFVCSTALAIYFLIRGVGLRIALEDEIERRKKLAAGLKDFAQEWKTLPPLLHELSEAAAEADAREKTVSVAANQLVAITDRLLELTVELQSKVDPPDPKSVH